MKGSLRARIGLTAILATATALLVVMAGVGPGLRRRAMERNTQTLVAEARLMARSVRDALAQGVGQPGLDRIVKEASHEVRARVTILSLDGSVLADSAVSEANVKDVENHADRPEFQQALASGLGIATRTSRTVGDPRLYAAVPIEAGGRRLGVARVSVSLEDVEAEAGALRFTVGLALAVAFALTVVASILLSSSIAGPIAQMMEAAWRFAGGDLTARIRVARDDELGQLGRILNQAAADLQRRLVEATRDQARTEAILSATEDGMLAVDARGLVVLANDALRRSLGLKDLVGRHYLEAIRQTEVGAVIEEVLRTGKKKVVEAELLHLRRVHVVTGVPFPDADGAPHGAVLTLHDVTERKRADRIRRDFVANASHELRTPLTSIRGFVEALEDGALAEPARAERFLGKIRAHADRMATLVEDLLALSRLEAGEVAPEWEDVRPSEVAEETAALFQDQAMRKGLALGWRDAGAPAVPTDSERVRRMLENLVDNAVKYTPEGGRVEILSAPEGEGGASISVCDDGPGIGAEHLPRIFERFYRVDKARSRELGGTGLGLAIVKHLAESVGARVSVESDEGRGARFTLHFPARVDTRAAGPGPTS